MKRFLYIGLTASLIVGALFVGFQFGKRNTTPVSNAPPRKILHYVDPMNPAHTSPEPGLAPCGMKMEPVYADDMPPEPGQLSLASLPPGSLRISSEKQQLIGVRTGRVERKPLHYTRRLLGRVVVDETRVYWINATVDGWITKALPYATGDYVRSNQVLAAFYSTEFLSAANALLFALNSQDRLQGTSPTLPADDSRMAQFRLNLQQYADALKNLGMGDPQIQEMIDTRQFRQNVDIISPADGFILSRGISEGLRFEQGTELYRLADLKRVWILADIFENEAQVIQPGREVRVALRQQQRSFIATISAALPKFDIASRTLKVRLEMDNPDYALQPDMFVDLEFPMELPEALFVTADALLDTGRRQTVFVDRGSGYFEPRLVKTGRRFGDMVEIVHGLEPGEDIVTAGTFLLDSESRMKLAASGYHGTPAQDPVCNMMVDESKARAENRFTEHEGTVFYFCNVGCKRKFDEDPARFLTKSPGEMHHQIQESSATAAQKEDATDPVCNMKVDIAEATAENRYSEYQGRTFYFCNPGCKRKFDSEPERFLKSGSQAMDHQMPSQASQTPGHDGAMPAPGAATHGPVPKSHQHGAATDALNSMTAMKPPMKAADAKDGTLLASDPVCGMKVDPEAATKAGRISTHQGTSYFFCNIACKRSFDEDPDWILKEITASNAVSSEETAPQPSP